MAESREVSRSLDLAINFIARAQEKDGGFIGYAATNFAGETLSSPRPTTFFTALTLYCLRDIEALAQLKSQAANFLLRHRSDCWSWNYWVRDSRVENIQRYPDDLDDTMCALLALASYDRSTMDGSALAEIAKLLITAEEAPGGPYRTWLVSNGAPATWRDIDVAVNANIGAFLNWQGVRLPSLEKFIANAIKLRRLHSPYYVGEVPSLYFIARWYRGEKLDDLRRLVTEKLEEAANEENSLWLAQLISAGLQLSLNASCVNYAVLQLLELQRDDGSWAASGLYFEPSTNGQKQYAGSSALTTAFSMEALRLWGKQGSLMDRSAPKQLATASILSPRQQAQEDGRMLPDPKLQQLYHHELARLIRSDDSGQITSLASIISRAIDRRVDPKTELLLNTASLQGWLARTIYDRISDDNRACDKLWLANWALRRSRANLIQAIPTPDFARKVDAAFDQMDVANGWEACYTRVVAGVQIKTAQLPEYGGLRQLADRSWGHSLAAAGVLTAAGLDPIELKSFEDFFQHYLIARQLNDDAHDWREDLRSGHLTAVVTMLLSQQSAESIDLAFNFDALAKTFWDQTIFQVADIVFEHTAQARQALTPCRAIERPAALLRELKRLDQTMQQALSERRQITQFIARFGGGPKTALDSTSDRAWYT